MSTEKVNSPERIKAHVAKFSSADDARAWREVAETVVGLVVFTGLWLHFWESPLPWFIFTVLTALTWTRVFIIFHDCAHYSFFSNAAANHRMALITGAWAVTPYERWRRNHNRHHKIFGDLDIPDSGQTIFFTKQDYDNFPAWKRGLARVLRDPVVFFVLAPAACWFIKYPIQGVTEPNLWAGWAVHFVLARFVMHTGWWYLLFPYIGGTVGVMLFHWQHAVNTGYRRRGSKGEWVFERGAIEGSAHLIVPWPLSWFTLGIEFHHIHHYSTNVPSYRLRECHLAAPPGMWADVCSLGPREAFVSLANTMWDEQTRMYVTF